MIETEEVPESKPIKNSYLKATLNIMQTAGWLQNKITQSLKPFDLSEPQYNVLRILRIQDKEPMNLYAIQEQMIQKMSNVSRLIDKLLEKKLVVRKACKDNRRRVDILITPKGLTLLHEAEAALHQLFGDIFMNIKKEKVKTLNKLLDSVRNEE